MVAGDEIHDRWRGERDGGDDGGAFSLSQSLSPFIFILFFSESVKLEDIGGGGFFVLFSVGRGTTSFPLVFFFF